MDSPLEVQGFEPSVPHKKQPFWLPPFGPRNSPSATKNGSFVPGTDGSNPSPSSGESATNRASGGSQRSSGFIERVKLQIEVLILKMRRNGELPSDHTQIGNDITHQIVSGSLLLERRGDSGFSHGRLFGCERRQAGPDGDDPALVRPNCQNDRTP